MNTIVHIGLLSLITAAATAATTILTFEGPGYVSQNLKYTYPGVGSSAWGSQSELHFSFSNKATIDFMALAGQYLSVGLYEDPAQYIIGRGPFFSRASFNLTNQGKSLSPIPDGWFKVLEIEVDQYGPKKFAADFVTYDSAGKYTAGSMRWNSNIAVTPISQIIPEVSTTSFILIGVLSFITRRRRRT